MGQGAGQKGTWDNSGGTQGTHQAAAWPVLWGVAPGRGREGKLGCPGVSPGGRPEPPDGRAWRWGEACPMETLLHLSFHDESMSEGRVGPLLGAISHLCPLEAESGRGLHVV